MAEPNKSYDLDSVKKMMWRDDRCSKLQCVDLERVERQGHCSFVDSCTFVKQVRQKNLIQVILAFEV